MSEPKTLPDVDDLLGPDTGAAAADTGLPDVDALLEPQASPVHRAAAGVHDYIMRGLALPRILTQPIEGPLADQLIERATTGRILDAFGQGAKQGWGEGEIGLSEDSQKWLREAGIFNDYTKGRSSVIKAFNESLIRPSAMVLDTGLRSINAAIGMVSGGAGQIVTEAGGQGKALERDLNLMMSEAFAGMPFALTNPRFPVNIPKARELGIIGEGDGAWKGTVDRKPVPPEILAETIKAQDEATLAEGRPTGTPEDMALQPGEAGAQAPEVAPDIHQTARMVAPDLFRQYDELDARRDTFRRWIGELDETRRTETAKPFDDKIAELQGQMEGASARNAKRYQTEIDDLTVKRNEALAGIKGDSPDMAKIRAELMKADEGMRDLAPEVSRAYRDAEGAMPPVEEVRPQPTTEAPAPEAVPEPATPEAIAAKAAVMPEEAPRAPEAAPAVAAQTELPLAPAIDIAGDVRQKLTAAGRPAEEADAASAIIASHYEARAQRLDTTAQDLYAREAPDIRAGKERAPKRELELAQKDKDGVTYNQEGEAKTDTPEFKKWFGDSKVVDADGKPLVLYHGSPAQMGAEFAFDPKKVGSNFGFDSRGFFFTDSKKLAEQYVALSADEIAELKSKITPEQANDIGRAARMTEAGRETLARHVAPTYLSIRNPLTKEDITASPKFKAEKTTTAVDFYDTHRALINELAKEQGRDGVVIKDRGDSLYVAFSPEQIKSVFNRGTFDPNDPRILYQTNRDRFRAPFEFDDATGTATMTMTKAEKKFWGELFDNPQNRAEMLEEVPSIRMEGKRLIINESDLDAFAQFVNETKLLDEAGNIPPRLRTFFQTTKGKIRLMDEGRSIITLFKSADASTFMHETGHLWLDELMRDAKLEQAVQGLKDDAGVVRKWLGAPEDAEITRGQHEKFARGFERYLMEGRAPNKALANVFEQFRQWLTEIYQSVAKLRSPITDDIRAVFDRLIAPEREGPAVLAETDAPRQRFADRHEARAEKATPETAAAEADAIRAETDQIIADLPEDTRNAINRGLPEEPAAADAGRRQPPDAEPADTGATGERHGADGAIARSGAVSEGRGQPAAEGAGTQPTVRTLKRTDKLHEKVPKEPLRLIDFLKKEGGLRDEMYARHDATVRGRLDAERRGSELQSIGARDIRGLVRAKTGLDLDAAALRAWEAGYFPEHAERPTINDFLDKLREDIAGNRQYSEHDYQALQDFRDALDRNAEIDRLADDLSIDITNKTVDEFWAEVSEKMSVRELEEARQSQAEALRVELEEAETLAKERADTWEPYQAPARTLEDLENERRQEYVAETARPSEGPAGQSGLGSKDAGQIQEGAGSRGDGFGAGRGASPETPEPVSPNDPIPPSETQLVDKAGNIRIDNLNIEDDVARAIREAADENEGFMADRGVVSDAQVLDLAEAMGVDAAEINIKNLAANLGQAQLASKIRAARMLLIDSSVKVRDAMAKARDGGDADVLAYGAAKERHKMIQASLSAVTAEWGRAGRAFQQMKSMEGFKQAEGLDAFLKENTGTTLYQLRREATLGAELDTPQKVSKFINDSKRATFSDMLLEFWINGLLSGPITQVKNIAGNTVVAVNRIAETGLAAVSGEVRQALGVGAEGRVMPAEVQATIYGALRGAQDGIVAGWHAFKTEEIQYGSGTMDQRKFQSIPSAKFKIGETELELGGKQVRIPGRLLQATDEFFKAVAHRQELNAIAYREASAAGLTGDRFLQRVAEVVTNPTDAQMLAARKAAEYQTFTRALGPTGRAIQNFANSYPLLKVVLPFIRTPTNIIKYAAERSPLGFLSREIRDNLSGKNGGVAQDTQIARMGMGTMLATAAVGLALEGLLTGSGPSTPSERAALRATGWQPNSVKIGDSWYSYEWLDPFSTILGIAGSMTEVAEKAPEVLEEKGAAKVLSLVWGTLAKDIMGKLSLRGASDLIKAVSDPDRYGQGYVQNLAGTVVPTSSAQIARTNDPVLREVRSVTDAMKARIPGLRQDLFPKRDVWGNEIPNQGAAGPDFLSPLYQSAVNDDPVVKWLTAIETFPDKADRQIRGIKLTDQQYDDYARISGRLMKARLDAVVNSGVQAAPIFVQREVAKKAVEESREAARNMIMMSYPAIINQALDNKLRTLKGEKPRKEQGE